MPKHFKFRKNNLVHLYLLILELLKLIGAKAVFWLSYQFQFHTRVVGGFQFHTRVVGGNMEPANCDLGEIDGLLVPQGKASKLLTDHLITG